MTMDPLTAVMFGVSLFFHLLALVAVRHVVDVAASLSRRVEALEVESTSTLERDVLLGYLMFDGPGEVGPLRRRRRVQR